MQKLWRFFIIFSLVIDPAFAQKGQTIASAAETRALCQAQAICPSYLLSFLQPYAPKRLAIRLAHAVGGGQQRPSQQFHFFSPTVHVVATLLAIGVLQGILLEIHQTSFHVLVHSLEVVIIWAWIPPAMISWMAHWQRRPTATEAQDFIEKNQQLLKGIWFADSRYQARLAARADSPSGPLSNYDSEIILPHSVSAMTIKGWGPGTTVLLNTFLTNWGRWEWLKRLYLPVILNHEHLHQSVKSRNRKVEEVKVLFLSVLINTPLRWIGIGFLLLVGFRSLRLAPSQTLAGHDDSANYDEKDPLKLQNARIANGDTLADWQSFLRTMSAQGMNSSRFVVTLTTKLEESYIPLIWAQADLLPRAQRLVAQHVDPTPLLLYAESIGRQYSSEFRKDSRGHLPLIEQPLTEIEPLWIAMQEAGFLTPKTALKIPYQDTGLKQAELCALGIELVRHQQSPLDTFAALGVFHQPDKRLRPWRHTIIEIAKHGFNPVPAVAGLTRLIRHDVDYYGKSDPTAVPDADMLKDLQIITDDLLTKGIDPGHKFLDIVSTFWIYGDHSHSSGEFIAFCQIQANLLVFLHAHGIDRYPFDGFSLFIPAAAWSDGPKISSRSFHGLIRHLQGSFNGLSTNNLLTSQAEEKRSFREAREKLFGACALALTYAGAEAKGELSIQDIASEIENSRNVYGRAAAILAVGLIGAAKPSAQSTIPFAQLELLSKDPKIEVSVAAQQALSMLKRGPPVQPLFFVTAGPPLEQLAAALVAYNDFDELVERDLFTSDYSHFNRAEIIRRYLSSPLRTQTRMRLATPGKERKSGVSSQSISPADLVEAILENHLNQLFCQTADLVLGYEGTRGIVRDMVPIQAKLPFAKFRLSDLQEKIANAGVSMTESELRKVLLTQHIVLVGKTDMLALAAHNVVGSVYRGSREIDHTEASYVTHAITTAFVKYANIGGESASRGEPGTAAADYNAYHEFSLTGLELERRNHRRVDPWVTLAFSYPSTVGALPNYLRKRTHSLRTVGTVSGDLADLLQEQIHERQAKVNLLQILTWIGDGALTVYGLRNAIAQIRQEIENLKNAGLREAYVHYLTGSLNEQFFQILMATYVPGQKQNARLAQELLKSESHQRVVKIAARQETVEISQPHPLASRGLTLIDYLNQEVRNREGTHEAWDFRTIELKNLESSVSLEAPSSIITPVFLSVSALGSSTLLVSKIGQQIGDALASVLRDNFDYADTTYRIVETGSTARGTEISANPDYDLILQFQNDHDRENFLNNFRTITEPNMRKQLSQHDLTITESKIGRQNAEGLLWTFWVKPTITGPTIRIELTIGREKTTNADFIADQLKQFERLGGDPENFKRDARLLKQLARQIFVYSKRFGGLGASALEQWILQSGGIEPGHWGQRLSGVGSLDLALRWLAREAFDASGRLRSLEDTARTMNIFDPDRKTNVLGRLNPMSWARLANAAWKYTHRAIPESLLSEELSLLVYTLDDGLRLRPGAQFAAEIHSEDRYKNFVRLANAIGFDAKDIEIISEGRFFLFSDHLFTREILAKLIRTIHGNVLDYRSRSMREAA